MKVKLVASWAAIVPSLTPLTAIAFSTFTTEMAESSPTPPNSPGTLTPTWLGLRLGSREIFGCDNWRIFDDYIDINNSRSLDRIAAQ